MLNKAEEIRTRGLIYDAIRHLMGLNREPLIGMAQRIAEEHELSIVQIISNA